MVYGFTRTRLFTADYALVGQIRRAVQSVTANMAEGFEREGNREFVQFLSHSKGSTGEVKDELYTALDENTSRKWNSTLPIYSPKKQLVSLVD